MSENEKVLRTLLAHYAANHGTYWDDGEMNDATVLPNIDFLRDNPVDIAMKLTDRNLRKLKDIVSHD